MRKLIPAAAFLFPLLVLTGYTPAITLQTKVVEGTVISERNHKPVANAHVYIVHGEEEALTNAKGEFSIETVQKFPLILTVDQQQHEKTRITISAPDKKIIITIKLKT